VNPVILSLFFLLSAFTPTALADGSEYVTITATPEQDYYDVADDEESQRNITFLIEGQGLVQGEEYKLIFELRKTVTQELVVSNTYGNTYRSIRMDQFGVDWEDDTNYTLFAYLEKKDGQGNFNTIDTTSFSFIIGGDPGTNEDGSVARESERDYRDNLTGQTEWEIALTIEDEQLNAIVHHRQWLDGGFWDELDENGDGLTLDSEVRSYIATENAEIGVEDIESPILSIGDGPLGWAEIEFDISHSITDDGRDLYVDWTITANSTSISGTSLSFLIELAENDSRLVDQYGVVFVHLESENWQISSVSTFGSSNDNMGFSKRQSEGDDYWSAEKSQGDALPDVKVILSSTVLGTESESDGIIQPPIDRLPDCQLSWNPAGVDDSTLITEELTGNFDLELEPGSYELKFQCDDQDGDQVEMMLVFGDIILTASGDQITHECAFVVRENMSAPLHFAITWSSNGTSGQLVVEVEKLNRPILILPDGQEIPGFTTVIATLGLLGAAFIRRD
jgi:hypothetical protein